MSLNTVELDVKTIEALASGTRRIILKKLYVKPLTVSEVSRELNINKSAIYKHLSLLVDTGLVSKNDSENEFIYYELTAKGKKVIGNDGNIKIMILLSSSVLTFIMGLLFIYNGTITQSYWGTPSSNSVSLIIGVILVLISLIIFVYILTAARRIHQTQIHRP